MARKKKKRRKEIVHGLFIYVPLRDYHLAYIIRALDMLIDHYRGKKMKSAETYCRKIRKTMSNALSMLIKETRKYNIHLKHYAFEEIRYEERKPEFKIFLDPEYGK